jgi:hypothetical protein
MNVQGDVISICIEASRTHADEPMAPRGGHTSSVQRADALVLADGRRLRVRPLGPADRDRLTALFARLSPESRYRRFLSPKPELMPRELVYSPISIACITRPLLRSIRAMA